VHAIRADLVALHATEVASFWFWLPKPSDLGMFTYEASAGWSEPHLSAGATTAEAWRLDGLFRRWHGHADRDRVYRPYLTQPVPPREIDMVRRIGLVVAIAVLLTVPLTSIRAGSAENNSDAPAVA
jgi:hypothetical protein